MADRIALVRNDTRPPVVVQLSDSVTADPIDLTSAAAVRLKFRAQGADELTATVIGTILPGRVGDDGVLSTDSPYDVAGAGGRVVFSWIGAPEALEGEAGNYEAEIEITYDDTTVQTVYETLKFKLRDDF